MSDNEFRLQREVKELKAEVRRLRRTVEGAFAVIGLVAVVLCPELLVVAAIAGIGYLAFLFTPLGRKIFPHFFHSKGDHEYDA